LVRKGRLFPQVPDTVGIGLRRALLGEIEGTCITRAKFGSVPHEYSTIAGIEESVQEILLNLKEIVLRSNLHKRYLGWVAAGNYGPLRAHGMIFVEKKRMAAVLSQ
jgi:DNA-directed RNA polymerase alpha subunit